MKPCFSILAGILLLGVRAAYGAGMLIPREEAIPPLAIESQRVDIRIKDGVATAKIEQVFRNSVNRNLEAVYVFPLPEGASISDFAMMINGKRMSGELVEKGKARGIYEDIVRRMKDPGLLEHLGGNLFRISVFPVPANGLQKIELEYSQPLTFDSGLYKYVYPLKTGERASRTLADFTVAARIDSKLPLKSIYSPSHKVGVARKGDHEATIGFEEDKALLDRDFVLYYAVSQKEFGLNLLTHAARDEKGFFLMMLAPSVAAAEHVMAKDVTFVVDTSGSMSGRKIEQTRKALEYGVRALHDGDRFNVIGFSTEVAPFKEKLVEVNARNREEALAFVQKIEARGGTAIHDALTAALAMNTESNRPAIIFFLTDGRPTIGETAPEVILESLRTSNKGRARIFVFGVGEDVNAILLDKLAGQNGGLPQYVLPDEDIEVKVSGLVDKMSSPVLTNVRVEVDKRKVSLVHPTVLPDLFRGDQVTVFGRYEGDGDAVIRLMGQANGKGREFVYEGSFPAVQPENRFIPRLWATRRVGYLLEEIRLRGESGELKEEVIRLSKEYGIMTPYTSYLVLEDENAYATHGIPRPAGSMGRGGAGGKAREDRGQRDGLGSAAPADQPERLSELRRILKTSPMSPEAEAAHTELQSFGIRAGGGVDADASSLREESGARAVAMSKAIQDYKGRENAAGESGRVRQVGKKVFTLRDGQWIDNAFKPEMKVTRIKFGSEEYFKLPKEKPELKDFLVLGTRVTIVLEDGTALVVE